MRGYNSRHIVILMSVSLMIREFIKRCLCTHCYLVVWSGVPQSDVLFPITFQGEEADLGSSYDIKYTSQGAVLN